MKPMIPCAYAASQIGFQIVEERRKHFGIKFIKSQFSKLDALLLLRIVQKH